MILMVRIEWLHKRYLDCPCAGRIIRENIDPQTNYTQTQQNANNVHISLDLL